MLKIGKNLCYIGRIWNNILWKSNCVLYATMQSKIDLVSRKNFKLEKDGFSVLQFNCLADKFSNNSPRGFPFVKKEFLDWKYRYPLLLGEIRRSGADLISMEEIDHFSEFEDDMKGYQGVFHKKKNSKDGIAVFWNPEKFKLLQYEEKKYSVRTQFGMFFLFQWLASKSPVVFAATHLKAKSGFEDVRLKQAQEMMKNAWELSSKDDSVPVILSGDFNEIQDSPMYKEIVSKNKFDSAYGKYSEPYTTYKERDRVVRRTIDYIFYKNLKCTSTLEIPRHQVFKNKLPAFNYPSDHLAIGASFKFQ